jgi:hypothetical protein
MPADASKTSVPVCAIATAHVVTTPAETLEQLRSRTPDVWEQPVDQTGHEESHLHGAPPRVLSAHGRGEFTPQPFVQASAQRRHILGAVFCAAHPDDN